MESGTWLEIINRDGWKKQQPLSKKITFIGSDPQNEVHLAADRGSGIEPLHAQLIRHPGGYNLVNASASPIGIKRVGQEQLFPQHVIALTTGDSFRVGEYTLVLCGNTSATTGHVELTTQPVAAAQRNLGLNLFLSTTRLVPERTIDGLVTVRNLGDKSGVKIELDVEGLDPECYSLEPGPLLSSGAEQDVSFRLFHRGYNPLAGKLQITLRATAPKAYPKDPPVTISEVIEVLPLYRHRLMLRDPEAVVPSDIVLALPPPEPRSTPYEIIHTPLKVANEPGPPEPIWERSDASPQPIPAAGPQVVPSEPKPNPASPSERSVELQSEPAVNEPDKLRSAPTNAESPTIAPAVKPQEVTAPAESQPSPTKDQPRPQIQESQAVNEPSRAHQVEGIGYATGFDLSDKVKLPVDAQENLPVKPAGEPAGDIERGSEPKKRSKPENPSPPTVADEAAGWGWDDEAKPPRSIDTIKLKAQRSQPAPPADKSERKELAEEWWTEEEG